MDWVLDGLGSGWIGFWMDWMDWVLDGLGSGWPGQVVAKRIRSGGKPFMQESSGRLPANASEPDGVAGSGPDADRTGHVYWAVTLFRA